jgi:hypothetical protein
VYTITLCTSSALTCSLRCVKLLTGKRGVKGVNPPPRNFCCARRLFLYPVKGTATPQQCKYSILLLRFHVDDIISVLLTVTHVAQQYTANGMLRWCGNNARQQRNNALLPCVTQLVQTSFPQCSVTLRYPTSTDIIPTMLCYLRYPTSTAIIPPHAPGPHSDYNFV